MNELTPEIFARTWRAARAGRSTGEERLDRMGRFMLMHEGLHDTFDRIAAGDASALVVEGRNVMLHVAMDAATEAALERDEPAGVRMLMQNLLHTGLPPGEAFATLSSAMYDAFLAAAEQGEEMSTQAWLSRAAEYAQRAVQQHHDRLAGGAP